MNSFIVFTGKELREQIKTFKGVVILLVMLIFSMTSPLMAKLTPELLKMAGTSGIRIEMPAPTFLDAYAQFYKNISQIIILIVMLIYTMSVVSETVKGTTSIMLTKRLSRTSFILSKFLTALIVWTVSYAVSAGVCIYYTVYLFPKGEPHSLFLSLAAMWLFGVVTISIALFSSAVFKNTPLCVIASLCIWGLTLFTGALPHIRNYSPSVLSSVNVQLLSGASKPKDLLWPAVIGAGYACLLLYGACAVFKRREL